MATIGFIGLGAMGLPMAKRLCGAGHQLKVAVHRDPAPAKEVERLGGKIVKDFAETVRDADYVVSILPEDKQIEEVLLSSAVMQAMPKKAVLIEMTSSSAEMMRRLAGEYAKLGIRVFDAPVSGGVAGATNGALTIMGGGDAALLEEIKGVLGAMATKIYLVGGVGAGKAMKAVNQLIAASNAVIVAEALELAKSQGCDLDKMYEVVCASSGNSYTFTNKFKKMAGKDFSGGFKLSLMKKDMRIALGGAGRLAMPLTSLAYQLFQMGAEEDQNSDFSVVSKIYSRT